MPSRSPIEFKNFIAGEYRVGSSGATFEDRSPLDGSVIGTVHEASQVDVDASVAAARAALVGEWGSMPVNERSAMLHAVANEIDRRFDDFLAAEMADTGKPVSIASHIDIPRGAANFRVFADVIKSVPTELPHRHPRRGRRAELRVAPSEGGDRGGVPVEPAAAADDVEGGPRAGVWATPSSSSHRRRPRRRQRCSAR
jgi:acyl-CoA reductase-like NAD-dependent aldehyde dehydrogenase